MRRPLESIHHTNIMNSPNVSIWFKSGWMISNLRQSPSFLTVYSLTSLLLSSFFISSTTYNFTVSSLPFLKSLLIFFYCSSFPSLSMHPLLTPPLLSIPPPIRLFSPPVILLTAVLQLLRITDGKRKSYRNREQRERHFSTALLLILLDYFHY